MMEPSPLLQRHHELQGPRPASLKVSSTDPATTTAGTELLQAVNKRRRRLHQQQAPPPRQPVIIYVESPRVVHAHPAEFKSVVQRLTGAPPAAPRRPSLPNTMVFSASSAPPPPLPLPLQFPFQFPLVGAAAAGSALLPLTSTIMSSSVVTVADAGGASSSVVGQENLSSDDPFLLPLPSPSLSSLAAACYHQQHYGGDLFIAHHQ